MKNILVAVIVAVLLAVVVPNRGFGADGSTFMIAGVGTIVAWILLTPRTIRKPPDVSHVEC